MKRFPSLALGLLAAALALPVPVPAATPYRPQDPAARLAEVPPRRDPALADFERLRRAAQARPQDARAVLPYAQRAIELGRARADPRYMGYAEAALAPWRGRPEVPAALRVLRATLAQHRHDFAAALGELDAVLAADPAQAQARLTRAVVRSVIGRADQAETDCRALAGRASALIVASCLAASRGLGPQAAAALADLEAALAAAPAAPAGERAWALTLRAELRERLGRADAGRAYAEAWAQEDPQRPDPYLLYAYADHWLEQNQPAEARALLAAHAVLDGAELRLYELAPEPAAEARLARRFEAARQRGDPPHAREQARFERARGRAAEALRLATENWALQREPADALLLADAALAAGGAEGARALETLRRWQTESGLLDVRLQRRLDGARR